MEHFLQEQNNRLFNPQNEFKEERRGNMEGLLSPRASSGLKREPKREPVVEEPPGLERGSDDRGLGVKKDLSRKDPSWGKQPEQVTTRDTDSSTTEEIWGKERKMYLLLRRLK